MTPPSPKPVAPATKEERDALLALAAWAQHRNTCGVFAEPGTGGKPQGCTCGLQEAAQDAIGATESLLSQRDRANARANSTEVLLSKQKFTIEQQAAENEELRGPHYVCRSCGYDPGNRAEWCNKGCGSDYNQMHKVDLAPRVPGAEG